MNHIEDEIDSDMKKKYICENITKITNHKNYLTHDKSGMSIMV